MLKTTSCCKTSLSQTFDRTGKTETGIKSFDSRGCVFYGIGLILAVFQASGKLPATI